MNKLIVGEDRPPPYMHGVLYWERSVDPFNPGLLAAAMQAEGLQVGKVDPKPAASGWLAIEWGENPVGFFSDGHMVEYESDEPQDYHFTDVGPSGHRIAERALNSLENARWFQSHGYILKRHVFSHAAVIEQTALIDCHAIILHEQDLAKFVERFATVQYKRHDLSPPPNINGKRLFEAPSVTEPPMRAPIDKPGEFITVVKRHGLKPKGTVSEFE